jgi:Flp pilus assembly pilin Flp
MVALPVMGRATTPQETGMFRRFSTQMDNEAGQALVEYALVVSLIALVCVGALTAIGVNVVKALQFPPGL